jgi:hypothetical protein
MRVLFECCDVLESHRVFSAEVKVLCCDCDERRLKTFSSETFSAVKAMVPYSESTPSDYK